MALSPEMIPPLTRPQRGVAVQRPLKPVGVAGVDPDAVQLALRYVEHCRKVGLTYMEGLKNFEDLKELSDRYESPDAFIEAFLRGTPVRLLNAPAVSRNT